MQKTNVAVGDVLMFSAQDLGQTSGETCISARRVVENKIFAGLLYTAR